MDAPVMSNKKILSQIKTGTAKGKQSYSRVLEPNYPKNLPERSKLQQYLSLRYLSSHTACLTMTLSLR